MLLLCLAQTAPEKWPVRFALVERSVRRPERMAEPALELVLATGERLRIGGDVDTATLRAVLDVLRAESTCQPACGCSCA